jgi:MYXO-CTERM domain-containing protein
MGFAFWSIIGTGVTLLMVAGLTRRRRRRDRQSLIVFENHKIQKDLP